MLQRILEFSIVHRWLVVLLAIAVAAVGALSLPALPIDAVPDITNNQVQINTVAPALSPAEIEKQVTHPVETSLAGIPGLQSTRSLSRNGFSQVTAVFDDGVNIYFARQQVSERLAAIRDRLPSGAEPAMGPTATGLGEVLMYTVDFAPRDSGAGASNDGKPGWQSDGAYLTPEGERLSGDVEQIGYLRTVQDWVIAPQLRSVTGLAGVDSIGGYVKQYHILPDLQKLSSSGITVTQLIEAIESSNFGLGAGYVEYNGESYTVALNGRLDNPAMLGDIAIETHDGVPILLKHLAEITIGGELRTGSASENGNEVVVGTALMLIGGNSRAVAIDASQRLEEIARSLPPGIVIKPVLNRTKLVDATIRTVARNLTEGAILVVVVLLLLLGNLRAALICALAIPMSMLMTGFAMVHGKISANLLSLGAIDFGIIVDGAVIIVENCLRMLAARQHELGRQLTLSERLETVGVATRQVRSATAFGELIIITVFVPILFLTGIEGKMFTPLAVVFMIALASAFVLSVTLVPALVAIAVRGQIKESENLLIRGIKRLYAPTLELSLRLRWVVVVTAAAAIAAAVALFGRLGAEFVPTLDEHDIAMHSMRIASTSLSQSQTMQTLVERTVAAIPEVQFVFSKTGTAEIASDPMPPNVSDTFIILKPKSQWRTESELTAAIEALEATAAHDPHGEADEHDHGHAPANLATHKGKLQQLIELTVARLAGNNYEFTQPIQMRFNELISGVRSDVAIKLFGDDLAALSISGEQIADMLRQVPGAADVKVEQIEGLPLLDISLDRTALARLGIRLTEAQDLIATAIGGRTAGQIFQGDRRFDIVVRLPDYLRQDLQHLRTIPIPLPATANRLEPTAASHTGDSAALATVPLGSIAQLHVKEGLAQIGREGGKRRVVVQANVRGRDIGTFVGEAKRLIDSQVELPSGSWMTWGGQFQNYQAARKRLALVVPLCFLVIFILLFSTFGSATDALMVFTGVPLALCGGVMLLWLRGMPFSISAGVGFIALSGVAVLNGVVMIAFINQLRAEGLPVEQAIRTGSMTRLRPVLMTAMVAALGFLPMALSTGTGAEVQKPLATVVIGGIVSSTLLTLVVLPALYRLLHRPARV